MVLPAKGKTLVLTQDQLKKLSAVQGVHAWSLMAQDNALLQSGEYRTTAYLKGVDENFTKVTGVHDKIVRGKFELGTEDHPLAVLGAGIESALNTEADRAIVPLSVYMFKKGTGDISSDPLNSLSNDNMATAGVFMIQQDFDDHYVITNLAFVKQMLGLKPDEYSGAELGLNDPRQAEVLKPVIQQLLGSNYIVQTRYEQNQSLYNVMGTEKWFIYVLLTLILVVASFNMVGALTMLVLEKQKDIHVLKALGSTSGRIQRIFLSEGILLALLGGVCGILLAVIICGLQSKYHFVPLQGGSFLIDYYPVKLVPTDFLLVLSTILIVALLASWMPARKAAATPIELR
jgi:lipoprotein-releasing system permease protein